MMSIEIYIAAIVLTFLGGSLTTYAVQQFRAWRALRLTKEENEMLGRAVKTGYIVHSKHLGTDQEKWNYELTILKSLIAKGRLREGGTYIFYLTKPFKIR